MAYEKSVNAKAVDLTRLAIEMTTEAGSGHPTTAASLAHLVTVLLYDHMCHDPRDPAHPRADRLVLSEGHACPIVYAAAADLGIGIMDEGELRPMTRDDIHTLRRIDSPLDGHPNPAEGFPFFPAATGSLGQGLSISAGLALAARLNGYGNRFYCIIGDGESREGQNWEAVDFIVDHELYGVCPIFNCNGLGQTAEVSKQQSPRTLARKLEAAGMTVRMIDGHDPIQIRDALEAHAESATADIAQPFAIVARTVKGWGFPSHQGNGFHGKPVSKDDLDSVMGELDETAREVGAEWTEGDLEIPSIPPLDPPLDAESAAEKKTEPISTLHDALKKFGEDGILKKGELATRKAYGFALLALGEADPDVVVLDGDVSNSTYSATFTREPGPASRFYECRIAEQNMVSCAVGLASAGKIPFASTFGKFMMRACDQIDMAVVGRFPVKLVGSHTGVSVGADGPSQMALSDVAFFRTYTTIRRKDGRPVMYLLNPADAVSAYALTLAMAETDALCYLRTIRPTLPFLYDEKDRFRPGGHQVTRPGHDVLIAASGWMVHEAVEACKTLAEDGIKPTVVDLYSFPFDENALANLARDNGGRVLTLEDNYGNGFGSAVADALEDEKGSLHVRQLRVRRIPKSGRGADAVLHYVGLATEDVVSAVRAMMKSVNV